MSRTLLQEQWDALRAWIEESGLLEYAGAPSALDEWTVRELIAHTGRSFKASLTMRHVDGEDALSIRQYVAAYPAAAESVALGARELAASIEDDLLGGVDDCAREGLAALDALVGPVVRGPRGAITLDDFIVTRVLELVVHGDDMERSVLEVPPAPLLDSAVALVSQALVEAYVEATGRPPEVEDELEWIRLAAGRTPSDDDALPLF